MANSTRPFRVDVLQADGGRTFVGTYATTAAALFAAEHKRRKDGRPYLVTGPNGYSSTVGDAPQGERAGGATSKRVSKAKTVTTGHNQTRASGIPANTPVTAAAKAAFLAKLCEGFSVTAAAQAGGHDRRVWYRIAEKDPAFKEAWREAEEAGTDVLEDEARRRALMGVNRPVYQGGKLVGHVNEFSDNLMTFLLKGRRPEKFRERQEVRHTGGTHSTITLEGVSDGDLEILEKAARIQAGVVDEAETITKEAATSGTTATSRTGRSAGSRAPSGGQAATKGAGAGRGQNERAGARAGAGGAADSGAGGDSGDDGGDRSDERSGDASSAGLSGSSGTTRRRVTRSSGGRR